MSKRITVPEGSIALVIKEEVAADLLSLCILLRRGRLNSDNQATAHMVAGDVLVAFADTGYVQFSGVRS